MGNIDKRRVPCWGKGLDCQLLQLLLCLSQQWRSGIDKWRNERLTKCRLGAPKVFSVEHKFSRTIDIQQTCGRGRVLEFKKCSVTQNDNYSQSLSHENMHIMKSGSCFFGEGGIERNVTERETTQSKSLAICQSPTARKVRTLGQSVISVQVSIIPPLKIRELFWILSEVHL